MSQVGLAVPDLSVPFSVVGRSELSSPRVKFPRLSHDQLQGIGNALSNLYMHSNRGMADSRRIHRKILFAAGSSSGVEL